MPPSSTYNFIYYLILFFLTNNIAYAAETNFTIDSSYQIISSYDSNQENINIQFSLIQESLVALELYTKEGKMIKLWNPQLSEAGKFRSSLPISEIPEGTYLLNVIINDEMYQQAVFKY